MDIAPRTKSRRTKRTNLGCAAFQGQGTSRELAEQNDEMKKGHLTCNTRQDTGNERSGSAARSWTGVCGSTVEAISGQLSLSWHFFRGGGDSDTHMW